MIYCMEAVSHAVSAVSHLAPHEVSCEPVEYQLVIPTRGRWRSASKISNERALKRETRPFILVKTLALLKRQRIPAHRVILYVSDEEERQRYKDALRLDAFAREIALKVGVPGILEQRNHITRCTEEGAYVVSLDDDLSEISWLPPGASTLSPLPDGSLEALIFHAHRLMRQNKAYIWGLNPSMNVRNLWSDGVSCRNGEINGFCYGFLNRHLETLLPCVSDALEDAERSLRFFEQDSILALFRGVLRVSTLPMARQDKIVLRYRMYTGITKCFQFEEGLQKLFAGTTLQERKEARKAAERDAAERLRRLFPELLLPARHRKSLQTLLLPFRPLGSAPLPVTTVAALREANSKDAKRKVEQAESKGDSASGKKRRKKSLDSASVAKEAPRVPEDPIDDEVDSRPSPLQGSSSWLSIDSDDEQGDTGLDENAALESILNKGGEDEDLALRQAMEESRKSLDYFVQEVNGMVADPLEEAKKRSLESSPNGGAVPTATSNEVDHMLAQLLEMGFPLDAASAALSATSTVEDALAKLC